MKLDAYIEKGGQKLRLGYTTGSCAAAAAKAAAMMLLSGQRISAVRLLTPAGVDLLLDIEEVRFLYGNNKAPEGRAGKDRSEKDFSGNRDLDKKLFCKKLPEKVSCAVRKDSGDDPDVTNQILIYAEVSLSDEPGVRVEGGEGIGRVTKPGLDQPVGNAAINSTPRKMIEEAVLEAAKKCRSEGPGRRGEKTAAAGTDDHPERPEAAAGEPAEGGFLVTISAPEGRELAARTFNPRLGIEGGISILGTSGIVEPMSDRALLDTIRVEVRVRREEGLTVLPVVPGNYGKNFFQEKYGFSLETAVTSSNFVYDTVQMAAEAGFTRMLFTGHIGKLVKVAGGIRNTHSQYGDHRMEILTEIAEEILRKKRGGPAGEENPAGEKDESEASAAGERTVREADRSGGPTALRKSLSDCVMTDEAVRILREWDLDREVLAEMTRRIQSVMQEWAGGRIRVEVIVFSNQYGELGRTDEALEYMRVLTGERDRGIIQDGPDG